MWQHVIYMCKNEDMSQSFTYFAIYIYQIVYVLQKKKNYIYIYCSSTEAFMLSTNVAQRLILSIPYLSNYFLKKIVF